MIILTLCVTFSLGLVGLGSIQVWQIAHHFQKGIIQEFVLAKLGGEIIHWDEVLTMSARMAAATGDVQWEQRYRTYEPQLDQAIKKAIALAPEAYAQQTSETDGANQKLVFLENQAFQLVRKNQEKQAFELLSGGEYNRQKILYAEGINRTINALEDRIQENLKNYSQSLSYSSIFALVSLGILTCAWGAILVIVNQYLWHRQRIEQQLKITGLALQESNHHLEETLEELKQVQMQVIQSEKMSSLGQLVAGVAHEINNPVNFIYGNLGPVRQYAEDLLHLIALYQTHYPQPAAEIEAEIEAVDLAFLQEDLPKILSSFRVGADRIHQIVVSLRNFSRTDESAFKEVDIHEGLESTLLILHHRCKSPGDRPAIEIVKNYGNLPLISCYPGPLNQVFMNLLANAIDALQDHPQPQITITTQSLGKEGLEITIADNGPGMTEAIRQRIFEPFFTTKPVGKGTGMGLSISKAIVMDKHCGTLECWSQEGQGTRFVIFLPLYPAI